MVLSRYTLIILVWVLCFFSQPSLAAENPEILLPFVLPEGGADSGSQIHPEDLKLVINGVERKVLHVDRADRNLNTRSDLSRDFILSFSLSEPDKYLKKGLSYFLTEILSPSDSLAVITPGKTFRIRVTPNKEGMHDDIVQLLTRECLAYSKKREAFSKSIRNELSQIIHVLSDTADNSSIYKVRRYKKIVGFLNTFPTEFNRLLQFSMALNESKFDSAVSDIKFRSGEKWWFHFHRLESEKLFSQISRVVQGIEEYSASSGDLFSQDHSPLLKRLKQLQFSTDFFPLFPIREKMVLHGIRFFSVIYSSSGDKDPDPAGNHRSVYDTIYDNIAGFTGGTSVYAVDPETGIRKVTKSSFSDYRIGFGFDGKFTDQKISLSFKKGTGSDIHHPSLIPEKELKEMVDHMNSEKVSIHQLRYENSRVSFRIRGYKFLEKQEAGLVRVRFEVLSNSGILLHGKENTLHSPVKDLLLQIPFPISAPGDYKVKITVIDLVDNHKTEAGILVQR